jgi:hypothetical protein
LIQSDVSEVERVEYRRIDTTMIGLWMKTGLAGFDVGGGNGRDEGVSGPQTMRRPSSTHIVFI